MSYKIVAVATQTIADSKITGLLEEIGDVLNNLLDSVISGENINEKEKLLEIAERRLHG